MDKAMHLEFFVEEPSMEAFLQGLVPRLIPSDCTFEVHVFRGKPKLLRNLPKVLRGYRDWLPADCRLVVMVDRDDDDCREIKRQLEAAAHGLLARSQTADNSWQIVFRIVIEELEAWYFGDWDAVRDAYPEVSANIPQKARFRDPDAVKGGTWEAVERILQEHGHFRTGLRKVEAARMISARLDPDRNRSRSFAAFRDVVVEATT